MLSISISYKDWVYILGSGLQSRNLNSPPRIKSVRGDRRILLSWETNFSQVFRNIVFCVLLPEVSSSREHGSLTIQDFERLCPDVNRRTLQRDLKKLAEEGLLLSEGETHNLLYRLERKGH